MLHIPDIWVKRVILEGPWSGVVDSLTISAQPCSWGGGEGGREGRRERERERERERGEGVFGGYEQIENKEE